jgi:single-stranded-DNA-specific exonuclease
VFIIDHHEIIQNIPEKVQIINPQLTTKQKISASGLCYLFAKEIDPKNKDLAKLGILGMIGDSMEKEISKLNNSILQDGEIKTKRGPLLFPSTRPLNRTLEYSSNPFIPGVTGEVKGSLELLREAGLRPTRKGYPSLLELTEEETAKLTTAIMLRNPKVKNEELLGDIYLLKMYGQLEDARELSGKINACSRYGKPETAIQLCLEIEDTKKKAESIHVKYRQELMSALKVVKKEAQEEKGYVIINAKEKIKDTMIGTITSILSYSSLYKEGTIIIGLSYYQDKVKVSGRRVGRVGRSIRELLSNAVSRIGGEVGGHEGAGGCTIFQEDEEKFLSELKKHLEIELIKV